MSGSSARRPGPDSLARSLVLLLVGLVVAASVLLVFDPITATWLEEHAQDHPLVDELLVVVALGLGGLAWILWRERKDLRARLRPRDDLETALSTARGTWRALVEHVPDFVLTLDRQGRITSINRTLPGIDEEEVLGTHVTEWVPADRREEVQARLETVLQEGISQEYEVESVDEEGRPAIYRGTIGPIDDGEGIVGATLVARDVTDEREAQAGLARQSDLYRTLLDAQNDMGQGIFIFDLDEWSILYANDASYELLDRSPAYVDSLPDVTMLVEEEARDELLEKMATFTEGATHVEHTFPIRDPAGRRRWLHASGRRLEEAPTTQIVVTMEDLTQQRRREEERDLLHQVTEDLAEAPDLGTGMEVILERLGRMDGWRVGEAWLQDEEGDPLQLRTLWTPHPAVEDHWREAAAEVEMEPGMILPGKAWDGTAPVWIDDVTSEPGFRRRAAARRLGLGAAVAVPIRARGETVAVLAMYNRAPGSEDEEFVDILSAVAGQIGETLRRRRAEEQVDRTRKRWEFLLSESPSVTFTARPGERLTTTYVSPNTEELSGFPAERFVEEPSFWSGRIHPDDRDRVDEALERLYTHDETVREYRWKVAEGTYRWFRDEMILLRDADGDPEEVVGSWIDITGRRATEERLSRAEEQFREIAETVDDLFWIASADLGEILYVSPAYEEISGRSVESLLEDPTSWHDWIHEEDRDRVLASLSRQREGHHEDTFRVVQPDGETRWIHQTAYPVREDGEIVRVVGVARDVTDLKTARSELERSADRLQRAQELAKVGDWYWDMRTDEITWSDELCHIHGHPPGWTPKDAKEAIEVAHPDDREAILAEVQRAVETGETAETIHRIVRPDGDVRWVHARIEPVTDASGEVVALHGTSQDITELEESQQRLLRAQEIADLGDWEHDLETDEMTWSPVMYELFDRDPAGGAPDFGAFLEQVHPADRDRLQDVFDRLPGEEGPFEREFRIRTGEGDRRWLWARIEVERDADGVPVRLVGTAQDVTDRKWAEADAERKARMLDEVGQAVIATDLDGTVTYWNAAAEALYGYDSDEALGRGIFELTVPEDAEVPAAEIMETLRRGEAWEGELECRRKDGTTFPAYVSDAPLLDDGGDLVGVIGVSHDMTEEKRREEALLRSHNEVEARNRHLRSLGQATAHPFQEAVRDVVRYLQLLERQAGERLTEEDREHLQTAVGGAKSLQRLVDDVAEFIEVSTEEPDPGPVDAGDVLEDVLAGMAHRIEEGGVEVTHDEGPLLGMGEEELKVLLSELIGNALGFRTEDDLHVHVGFEREGDIWVLSVADDGPGIPERHHERIFRPFQTLEHRTRGAGSGVGLALCRSIVEAHGGNMWVVSRPGEGATFHATLPMPRPVVRDDTDPDDEDPVADPFEGPVTPPRTTSDRTG